MKRWTRSRSGVGWRSLVPAGLAAIAAGLALAAAIAPPSPEAPTTLMPVAASGQARGLRGWLGWGRYPQQPLVLPPPVLPQPLPPQQAWPELPLVQAQPGFSDLDSGHWAWPVLADLSRRNLVTGFPDGTFRPTAPMTRAEFAAQLAQLFPLSPERSQQVQVPAYADVAASNWAYDSVRQAVQMGFLSGYPDNSFLPNQTISRIHVIVALSNGLTLKSSSNPATALKAYPDHGQVPPWALRPLVAAVEAGLVVNYPDRDQLAPNRPASRAEVAVMLHRALVYTGSLKAVQGPGGGLEAPTP
ncbi:S-layer homology domain-containing protein [Leptolyngbya sp. KIOST-1]|uniref:S-layer homology domain-containing protein n=1 Tax=Leptolyngbya sp. KIOST-1 TaxID=1229172 RepID=UPI0018CD29B2|nr:S-layer homology domain-containing protein [Leptolyngbya sp. KIOST-1]